MEKLLTHGPLILAGDINHASNEHSSTCSKGIYINIFVELIKSDFWYRVIWSELFNKYLCFLNNCFNLLLFYYSFVYFNKTHCVIVFLNKTLRVYFFLYNHRYNYYPVGYIYIHSVHVYNTLYCSTYDIINV